MVLMTARGGKWPQVMVLDVVLGEPEEEAVTFGAGTAAQKPQRRVRNASSMENLTREKCRRPDKGGCKERLKTLELEERRLSSQNCPAKRLGENQEKR